jgi:hypothetical protein
LHCGGKFFPARVASTILAELVAFPFTIAAAMTSKTWWAAALLLAGFGLAYLAVKAAVPLVKA